MYQQGPLHNRNRGQQWTAFHQQIRGSCCVGAQKPGLEQGSAATFSTGGRQDQDGIHRYEPVDAKAKAASVPWRRLSESLPRPTSFFCDVVFHIPRVLELNVITISLLWGGYMINLDV